MTSDEGAPARRPILQLKTAKPAGPPAPPAMWKCKPCGTAFPLPEGEADEWVRCPHCNARLGRVADFQADPPPTRLRARPAGAREPKPAKGDKGPVKVEVARRKLAKMPPLRPAGLKGRAKE